MFLAAGYWRGRVQTTSMRVFDNLPDAWAWAQKQRKLMGNEGKVWEVSSSGDSKCVSAKTIQKMLAAASSVVSAKNSKKV